MEKREKIYIAGHNGLVGSAIQRLLAQKGYENLITRDRSDLDLIDEFAVKRFFVEEKPKYVFLAAAKVGGILANDTYPVDFIRDNLKIQTNIIEAAYQNDVKKLLFMGSSCIYPRLSQQPIKEEYLLSGALEPTNEWYAIAKIAGIKMIQAYRKQFGFNGICLMPTNLYGPGDNFDLKNSHVLPALIRKFHMAKKQSLSSVIVWGSGLPRREFLYVDDLAEASYFLMQNYNDGEIINVGVGEDISIKELAFLIKETVGYKGDIEFDLTKPDGTPRKLLDVSKLKGMGWAPKTNLEKGIELVYNWFVDNYNEDRL